MIRGGIGITSAVLLAASLWEASAPDSNSATLPVTGYQEGGDATSLIDASAVALNRVGIDGVNINTRGTNVTSPDVDARRQLARAHAKGLAADLLIGNFNESIGDFDEEAAHKMLSSSANIAKVASTLKRAVSSQGWDGVTIDLESLRSRDTAGLVRFATKLNEALPAGKVVGIDITNFETAGEFTQNGYNLTALGKAVDNVALMAYDQHGWGDSGPGPVGALSWQKKGLGILLSRIPARKIDLGVAGYGYSWAPDGSVRQVGDQEARHMVTSDDATARWDTRTGEWTAKLSDGTVLWWSDARSFAKRRALATSKGIHGLAVWDLGLSDPIAP